jgi:prophage DNA circulation protein
MAGWDDLQQASYDGLEFEVVSSSDEGGSVLDKQQFPGRNGQQIDDRAAAAESYDWVIDFIEGEYPQTLNNFLKVLRAGGVKELVHPFHGSLQAAVETWRLVHDPEDSTDSARMQVKFQVHTEGSATTPDRATLPAMANAARSACDDVTAAALAYELLADGPAQKQACTDSIALSSTARTSADTLESDGDIMSAAAIQGSVNSVIARADSIAGVIADYTTAEAYALGAALTAVMGALSTLGGAFIAAKPPIIEEPVVSDVNLLTYVHERYGDSSRATELFALNGIRDPLEMPASVPVRRYAF